jgi:lantibiotic modifying enzyme
VEVVESAVGADSAATPAGPPARAGAAPAADDRLTVLTRPLRPFLDWVGDRLTAAARDCLRPEHADPGQLADAYLAVLGDRLGRLALPALIAEFGTAPSAGDKDRQAAEFAARLCAPGGLMTFLARYPVLARQLAVTSRFSLVAGVEVVTRFAADRAAIVGELLGGADPGPVVAVRPGLGDQHCSGRSVMAVTFADGRTLIYKPRSQAAHAVFGEILGWINQRVPGASLRGPAVVSRPDYGWLEFIANDPLPTVNAAADFYRREGILLAALYATHASDMHYENVIASGAVPVIVDIETLFHPALPAVSPAGGDPAAEALAGSVYRAALLPLLTVDDDGVADKSGMGGDGRGGGLAGNRPHVDGKPVGPAGYEAALIEGFRLGYAAIAAEQASFSRLIEHGADLEVRTVIRASRGYADLIGQFSRPDLLRDAGRLDEALGVLRDVSAGHPLWAQLAEHEIADLWDGDIPLLTSRASSSDLLTSAGRRFPGILDRPGLSCALDKVAAMDDADLRRQSWIIAASLATSRPHEGHRGRRAAAGPLTATAAGPDRLLTAACGLANHIVADASTGPDDDGRDRVNWLGLQLVEDTHWMLLPMGAGLADGYLGVALFLAQLGQLTGISWYTDVAWRSLSAVPGLLAMLGARAELLPAVGCGGAHGLGGMSYGLARLSVLLHDAELASQADLAAELAAAANLTATPGWTAGTAGCLAAMMSVQAETGSRRAAELARTCADLLRDLVEETDGRCAPDDGPVPLGFAAGPAGVGWALTRFAGAAAEPAYRAAGHRAAQRAVEAGAGPAAPAGWCSGLAGLLLARSCLSAEADPAGPDAAIRDLDREAVLADLSLCHGELGVAEAFTVLTATAGSETAYHARRRRAGIVLDVISRQPSYCGTPGGLVTTGLFTGLAGIGYGLLRLGFAEEVPSVLLLEPGAPS